MPFTTFNTKQSSISEDCLWIHDGNRYICVSYIYIPNDGRIHYAASVLKSSASPEDLTEEQITGHEHTTTRRFQIRPTQVNLGRFLPYDEMLKQIRREMCHGAGCVGTRYPVRRSDDEESLSSVEMMSDDTGYEHVNHEVSPLTYNLKTVHCTKYSYVEEEPHGHDCPFTHRTIFICFKGLSNTGDVLYGACIHHEGIHSLDEYYEPELDDDSHYETAMMRLEKCPVQMSITEEFRHQLDKYAAHREDVIHTIVDKIKSRVGGHLQIKGSRLWWYKNN
jgi:hypothetical protein